jgi:hypothetical protein
MAIKACTQEQGHLLRNREHMQVVKESLDEGYCDISGRVGDLDFVGVSLLTLPHLAGTHSHLRRHGKRENLCFSG